MKNKKTVIFYKFCLCFIFIICQSFLINSNELGTKIILLYQSITGDTEKENLGAWHLYSLLEQEGFNISYVDINGKLPDVSSLHDVFAVIGWLGDNAHNEPEKLLNWYVNILDNEIKLILMGAIGCWQNKKTKKYLLDTEVNRLFSRLGVIYRGGWTNKKNNLLVTYNDSSIYPSFSFESDTDYFLFQPIRQDVNSFLIISKRGDKNSASSVVFNSPAGGYVFTNQYILNKDSKKIINLKEFLLTTLYYQDFEQKIMMADSNTIVMKTISQIFYQARINLKKIKIPELETFSNKRLSLYNTIILENCDFYKTNQNFTDKLKKYVEKGGGLVIAAGKWPKNLKTLLNIKKTGKSPVTLRTEIDFNKNIYLESGSIHVKVKEPEDKIMTLHQLSGNPQLLVYGFNKKNFAQKVPIAWRINHGQGTIIAWANQLFYHQQVRTIFFQTSLMALSGHAQIFANIGVLQLDDFPIPSYNQVSEIPPVMGKYQLTDTNFYLNHGLADLLAILRKHDIKMSAFTIFNYNGKINEPFPNGEFLYGEHNSFKKMFDMLIDNGHEIGLHGYNHQSLTLNAEVTKSWPDQKTMETGLKFARTNYKIFLGPNYKPFSYVAPMNVVDRTGIKALLKIFPSIKVISTLYAPSDESYETDMFFGLLENTDVYLLPRTSWGFHFDEEFLINLSLGMWEFGIWTHFIHLDDVYDNYRSRGVQWHKLKQGFEEQLNYIKRNYSFLRFYTTRQAYFRLLELAQTDYRFYLDKNKNIIKIKVPYMNDFDKYVLVRLPFEKTMKNLKGAKITHILPNKEFLVLKLTKNEAILEYK